MRKFTTLLVLFVFAFRSLPAQEPTRESSDLQRVLSLSVNQHVRVTYNGRQAEGRLNHLQADSVLVGTTHIGLIDIDAVDRRVFQRDPLWNGAALGVAAIISLALLSSGGYGDGAHTSLGEVAGGLLVGAATGLMIDAARERTQWSAAWPQQ